MSTFVLVPGGFHGGWSYVRVARALRADGHDVYTPTLTGVADRSHLLTEAVDLETHIQDIVNLILWEDLHDVVLGGHSYGGFVITGVADRVPDRIATLAYIDGVIPSKDGESVEDRMPEAAKMAAYKNLKDGDLALPAYSAVHWVTSAEDQAWVDSKTTPHPLASLRQPITLTGEYERVPLRAHIYAVGGAHEAISQSFVGQPRNFVRGIENSRHDMMVDQPEALTAALLEAAVA